MLVAALREIVCLRMVPRRRTGKFKVQGSTFPPRRTGKFTALAEQASFRHGGQAKLVAALREIVYEMEFPLVEG